MDRRKRGDAGRLGPGVFGRVSPWSTKRCTQPTLAGFPMISRSPYARNRCVQYRRRSVYVFFLTFTVRCGLRRVDRTRAVAMTGGSSRHRGSDTTGLFFLLSKLGLGVVEMTKKGEPDRLARPSRPRAGDIHLCHVALSFEPPFHKRPFLAAALAKKRRVLRRQTKRDGNATDVFKKREVVDQRAAATGPCRRKKPGSPMCIKERATRTKKIDTRHQQL